MNTITILHREVKDTTQLETPNLNSYHESIFPTLRGYYHHKDSGKERFRLKENVVEFYGNTTDQDVRASMELLQKKGVTEVVPHGTQDFMIAVHQAGYHKHIEVVHPDLLDEPEEIQQNQPTPKGPRPR